VNDVRQTVVEYSARQPLLSRGNNSPPPPSPPLSPLVELVVAAYANAGDISTPRELHETNNREISSEGGAGFGTPRFGNNSRAGRRLTLSHSAESFNPPSCCEVSGGGGRSRPPARKRVAGRGGGGRGLPYRNARFDGFDGVRQSDIIALLVQEYGRINSNAPNARARPPPK
jgi:hypothetical protein